MRELTNNRLKKIRSIVLAVTVIIVLDVINLEISKKEAIIADGSTILLRIAPRDPRSLLQGDYMALRYTLAETVAEKARDSDISDGLIVVELADSDEADFVAIYDGQPLTDSQ
ncbi:MAG: GDYXXLXY domain-containing protein, partial [Woeseia sp.]